MQRIATLAVSLLLIATSRVDAQVSAALPPAGTTTAATGEPPASMTTFLAELSSGYEHYSSPLVRLSDEGPLVLVEGRSKLVGHYVGVSVSGSHMVNFAGQQSVQVNAALRDRNFRHAGDLNFRHGNVDVLYRLPVGTASAGIGAGVQRIAVGGRHFRQRIAAQADLFFQHGQDGYTSIVLDQGNNRHAVDNRELDASAGLALVRRQFTNPRHGIDEFAIEAGVGRERNIRGNHDLSSRQLHLRMNADWQTPGLKWTLSLMLQRSRFEAELLPGMLARVDRFAALDIGVEYTINPHAALRADWSQMINKANTVLYESRYRGGSVTLLLNH